MTKQKTMIEELKYRIARYRSMGNGVMCQSLNNQLRALKAEQKAAVHSTSHFPNGEVEYGSDPHFTTCALGTLTQKFLTNFFFLLRTPKLPAVGAIIFL